MKRAMGAFGIIGIIAFVSELGKFHSVIALRSRSSFFEPARRASEAKTLTSILGATLNLTPEFAITIRSVSRYWPL
ncbi:MAG TPA: hypothetical protein PKY50_03720 [Candidatus Competibacter sp.]|nr:hypothetical protein [Candidatus Competibacter sp.]